MLLPSGIPIKTGVNPATLNLPDALEKLRVGLFSGYLRFLTKDQAGVVLFENGRLIGAYHQPAAGKQRYLDMDALGRIFELSMAGDARLDIYKLSPELAMSAHALLRGEVVYRGQDLGLVDIKTLMGKVKQDRLNGCLRIYADDKTSLIFYEDGSPLGFFHDGSAEIETTADTSLSVARLPGAKVDVIRTQGLEELTLADLLKSEDLVPMWRQIQQQVGQRKTQKDPAAAAEEERKRQQKEDELRNRLPQLLHSIAEKDLGKLGPALIDREFGTYEGPMQLDALLKAIAPLEKAATLVAGRQAVMTMMADMRQALAVLLKA